MSDPLPPPDPALTLAERCKLATDCLPPAEYRTRLERLHGDMLAEIARLRAALSIAREYPDFDSGGALPEMMDQVLRGLPAPMLDTLDLLGLGPNVRGNRALPVHEQE